MHVVYYSKRYMHSTRYSPRDSSLISLFKSLGGSRIYLSYLSYLSVPQERCDFDVNPPYYFTFCCIVNGNVRSRCCTKIKHSRTNQQSKLITFLEPMMMQNTSFHLSCLLTFFKSTSRYIIPSQCNFRILGRK